MRYSQSVYKAIIECVERYSSPQFCQHLPSLRTGFDGMLFVGKRNLPAISNDDGNRQTSGLLKYVETTPHNKRRRDLFLLC